MTIGTSSRILLVEDKELLSEQLREVLEAEGYEVVAITAESMAATFIQTVATSTEGFIFDLIIFNLLRPQLKGLELCRIVRSTGNPVPILILSERSSDTDIVLGLEMGADDYLTKPFGLRELIARIRASLRRPQRFSFLPQISVLQWRDVVVYPQDGRVFVLGQLVHLPLQELHLLVLLMSSPYQTWSREQLLHHLWDANFTRNTKMLDVYIHRLREKLEFDPSQPEYIITVEETGYRLG